MEEIVHVIPMGWEKSRVIEPLKYVPARRAYLLYRTDHPTSVRFADRAATELDGNGVEVRRVPLVDQPGAKLTREFDLLLFHISRIVMEESGKRNRVYLNISASGKIAAAACFLVGMYHWDRIAAIYYARPRRYTVEEKDPKKAFEEWGLSIGMAGIEYLPKFKLERPSADGLHLLAVLYERGPLPYLGLLQTLREYHQRLRLEGAKDSLTPFAEFDVRRLANPKRRSSEQSELNSWVAKLKRYALDGLVQGQYVELRPSHEGPTKLVDLTEHGRYAALLSGFVSKLS